MHYGQSHDWEMHLHCFGATVKSRVVSLSWWRLQQAYKVKLKVWETLGGFHCFIFLFIPAVAGFAVTLITAETSILVSEALLIQTSSAHYRQDRCSVHLHNHPAAIQHHSIYFTYWVVTRRSYVWWIGNALPGFRHSNFFWNARNCSLRVASFSQNQAIISQE